MAALNTEIASSIAAACRNGADEAAQALGRALGHAVTLTVAPPVQWGAASRLAGFDGPGLALVLTVAGTAAVVLLPESSGLLPAWYGQPDPTGQSKLDTLAQELAMILLPEPLLPEEFQAGRVKILAGALGRGGVSDEALAVPLQIQAPGTPLVTGLLVWPASRPKAILGAATAGGGDARRAETPAPASAASAAAPPAAPPQPAGRGVSSGELPLYARSLLRIQVPVVVTLAQKRELLGTILQLGPGSIIDFDKSCEEMLALDVGGRTVACGEAVKVGDKFGLRITSIVLPEERFQRVQPP